MDIGFIKAIIMGVVEGLTEFIPVSSTGHLILAGEILKISGEKAKLFEVFIQLGAILAVVWIYRNKIFSIIKTLPDSRTAQRLCLNLFIAFMPAALFGFFLHKIIKQYLFSSLTVSFALLFGGVIIYVIERQKHKNNISDIDNITLKVALYVGIAQVFALFPGVSRSAATIMGGILAGLDRKASTEFSFFLAIPTMFAATMFDLLKNYSLLSFSDVKILTIGFVSAFISALWVVNWLIKFVSNHDFKPFAYYRIAIGITLLLLILQ